MPFAIACRLTRPDKLTVPSEAESHRLVLMILPMRSDGHRECARTDQKIPADCRLGLFICDFPAFKEGRWARQGFLASVSLEVEDFAPLQLNN